MSLAQSTVLFGGFIGIAFIGYGIGYADGFKAGAERIMSRIEVHMREHAQALAALVTPAE